MRPLRKKRGEEIRRDLCKKVSKMKRHVPATQSRYVSFHFIGQTDFLCSAHLGATTVATKLIGSAMTLSVSSFRP